MKYELFSALKLTTLMLGLGVAVDANAEQAEHEHHQHEAIVEGEADPHAHHKAMLNKPPEPAKSTRVDLLDRTLVDQDGREVKFVSDVIGDRIVVMDFVYTSCTTVCPVLSALFGQG